MSIFGIIVIVVLIITGIGLIIKSFTPSMGSENMCAIAGCFLFFIAGYLLMSYIDPELAESFFRQPLF